MYFVRRRDRGISFSSSSGRLPVFPVVWFPCPRTSARSTSHKTTILIPLSTRESYPHLEDEKQQAVRFA